ncbi:protocadherin alpha-C2-like [Oscarella lobularis]|uniref:protocadherin alpha-C2-like n=1 Tax=Oscarella lobularis TaxID=121494 RepID=UPI003313C611
MSTDSGSPPMSVTATFIVRVLDVNEKPTSISINSNTVPENSGANTRIGKLSTTDPDNLASARQTFTYSMLDGASGRFRLDGGVVEVAASNAKCLALGGKECLLNIEEKKEYDVVVRATDSGSPALSIDYVLMIQLTDVNDRPRALDLSHEKVFENAPAGMVVGKLSSTDDDVSQTTTYTLIDDDNGRFKIVGDELQKATSADYETFNSHTVIVEAKDNGKPALSITKSFTIEVLDVNEAPIRINVTDENGQLKFANDHPLVEELSPVGAVVGKIVAMDHDENETLTFRLDDTANGKFSLGASATCKTITDKPVGN